VSDEPIKAHRIRIAPLDGTGVIETTGWVDVGYGASPWDDGSLEVPCALPERTAKSFRIEGTFTYSNPVLLAQILNGIEPSIKYGEHRWGAFA
jgi:hypothetical protein